MTIHPSARMWLGELEQLLVDLPPAERADVLAGLREHLEAAVPPGTADGDVRHALQKLGAPEAVADEAYAASSATRAPLPARASSATQAPSPVRASSATRASSGAAPLSGAVADPTTRVAASDPCDTPTRPALGGPRRVPKAVGLLLLASLATSTALVAAPMLPGEPSGLPVVRMLPGLVLPFAVVAAFVLIGAKGTMWTLREKLALVALVPVALAVAGIVVTVFGTEASPERGSLAGIVAHLPFLLPLGILIRRGLRRTTAD